MNEAANLWQAFSNVARAQGPRPALMFADDTVSFTALHDLALRAAAALRAEGVRRGDVVALHLPKRKESYAWMLACLRLGAIYCCLDPNNPADRTSRMLKRLEPKVLVAQDVALNPYGTALFLSADFSAIAPLSDEPPSSSNALDPAYIMFTSGSTGEPKGAVICHQGVLNLMAWSRGLLGEPSLKRFTALNPLHFDNSVFDFYCGLVSGAALLPIETSAIADPAQWAAAVERGQADTMFAVPSLFLLLDDLGLASPNSLPSIQTFLFGGEGFPIERLRAFFGRFEGRARFINVYGPTETSCICSSLEIDAAALQATTGFASLGRMHAEFDYAVLSEDHAPSGAGEVGELWIGGPNVGLGYYANPEETARRFQQDPRQTRYRSIFYRTGDLVREANDGTLWFVGRADNQVKVNGHRIELEEIDHVAQSIEGVRRAAAIIRTAASGNEICLAYCCATEITPNDITAALATRLPSYMRPVELLRASELPLNANGKVDRLAVRALFANPETKTAPLAAPSSIREVIATTWREALNLRNISEHDNFFDLGATSILLRKAHVVLEQRLGRRIEIVALFEHPTIAELDQFLQQGEERALTFGDGEQRGRRQREALQRLRRAKAAP